MKIESDTSRELHALSEVRFIGEIDFAKYEDDAKTIQAILRLMRKNGLDPQQFMFHGNSAPRVISVIETISKRYKKLVFCFQSHELLPKISGEWGLLDYVCEYEPRGYILLLASRCLRHVAVEGYRVHSSPKQNEIFLIKCYNSEIS